MTVRGMKVGDRTRLGDADGDICPVFGESSVIGGKTSITAVPKQ